MDIESRHYDHIAINDCDVCNIVLSYLMHNCFTETAESFLGSTSMKHPDDYPMDIDKRKRCESFVTSLQQSLSLHWRSALKAIELTEQLDQGLLEENKDLLFDLLSLHFVDLICLQKCTEALEFAQARLTPFGKMPKYVAKLEDFMALLAYEEPEKSPMFHLLSPDYRQNVAANLNRAILARSNLPRYSSMERLIQQAAVATHYLTQESKEGPRAFSLKSFLKN